MSRSMPEGTEENYKIPHTGYSVSVSRFEFETFRIQSNIWFVVYSKIL
jgi:hypothetical protein